MEFSDIMTNKKLLELYENENRRIISSHSNIKNLDNKRRKLEKGLKPLTTNDEVDTYFVCYFGLHFCKLYDTFKPINFQSFKIKNVNLFDWGCGVGTASLAFINQFLEQINIKRITLIEPSNIATIRGKEFIEYIAPSINISIINKTFDNLIQNDFKDLIFDDIVDGNESVNIHIFSNVLDILTFSEIKDIGGFIPQSFTGHNYFICVSTTSAKEATTNISNFYDYFCTGFQIKTIVKPQSNKILSPPILFTNTGITKPADIFMFKVIFAANFPKIDLLETNNETTQLVEINHLNNGTELTQLQNGIKTLQVDIQVKDNQLAENEQQLVSYKNEIAQLQNSIKTLQVDIQTRDNQLLERKKELEKRTSEITQLKSKAKTSQSDVQIRDSQLAQHKQELASQISEITQLKNNLTLLQSSIQAKNTQVAKHQQELVNQKNEVIQLQNSIKLLQTDIQTRDNQLIQKEQGLVDHANKVNQLEIEIQQKETHLSKYSDSVEQLVKQIHERDETITKHKQLIKKHKQTINQLSDNAEPSILQQAINLLVMAILALIIYITFFSFIVFSKIGG